VSIGHSVELARQPLSAQDLTHVLPAGQVKLGEHLSRLGLENALIQHAVHDLLPFRAASAAGFICMQLFMSLSTSLQSEVWQSTGHGSSLQGTVLEFCFDRHAEPVQASATDVGHSAAARRQRPSTGQRVRPAGHAAGVGHAVDDDDDDDDGSLLSLTHEPSAGHRMGRLVGQGLGVPHSPTEEAHEPSLQITRA
jgi:hypothetical protein